MPGRRSDSTSSQAIESALELMAYTPPIESTLYNDGNYVKSQKRPTVPLISISAMTDPAGSSNNKHQASSSNDNDSRVSSTNVSTKSSTSHHHPQQHLHLSTPKELMDQFESFFNRSHEVPVFLEPPGTAPILGSRSAYNRSSKSSINSHRSGSFRRNGSFKSNGSFRKRRRRSTMAAASAMHQLSNSTTGNARTSSIRASKTEIDRNRASINSVGSINYRLPYSRRRTITNPNTAFISTDDFDDDASALAYHAKKSWLTSLYVQMPKSKRFCQIQLKLLNWPFFDSVKRWLEETAISDVAILEQNSFLFALFNQCVPHERIDVNTLSKYVARLRKYDILSIIEFNVSIHKHMFGTKTFVCLSL